MKRSALGVCWQVGVLATALMLSAGAVAGAPETEDELANFVIQDCGSCHGLKLKGGLGPPLRPEDIETLPEAAIAAIIREGVPGTAMPPWKALLSDQEIAWISRQLKSGALIAPEVDSSRSR
ncbi:c-type cytochrome [Marinobacter nauticus]|uniref:Cytochrome c, mono-and diheme variant n=1 Tax=Marinobacter nauticus (strain ATCC 700491 / DSM 11845 / VT8) TaxID=351348 RepID=A1U5C9_MARN8|nr:cytochrome c [Marinobacter nauticus]ABM20198.1 cytochrome c, mono- and diheme variant [Marinobacter nauticus VT8]